MTARSASTMSVEGSRLRCRWRRCAARGPFANDEELFEHLNDAHNPQGVLPDFRCKWSGCTGRFQPQRRDARMKHLITHTEHRPHVCGVCSAAFRRRTHLKNHGVKHVADKKDREKNEPEEAVGECKACEKAFTRASALKANMHVAHRHQSDTRTRRHRSGVASGSSQSESKGLRVEEWSDEEAFAVTHLGAPKPAEDRPNSEDPARHGSELMNDHVFAAENRIEELQLQRAEIEALLREAQADLALTR